MPKTSKPDDSHPSFSRAEWLGLGIVFVVIIAVWLLTPRIVTMISNVPICGAEQRGQFGDSYAVTNTLFSGLAFFGLVAALFFQRRDLMAQVKALSQQVTEFESQNELTRRQMAFQEVQTLIEALPMIALGTTTSGTQWRDPSDNTVKMRPTRQSITINNSGAEIYKFRFRVHGHPHASLETGLFNKLNPLQIYFDVTEDRDLEGEVSFVTRLGEAREIAFTITPNCSMAINDFAADALSLRQKIYRRFELEDTPSHPAA